jgi:hypothetical protein
MTKPAAEESAPDMGDIIPRPAVIRERLARNIRERRMLESLLKISLRAAEWGLLPDVPATSAPRSSGTRP